MAMSFDGDVVEKIARHWDAIAGHFIFRPPLLRAMAAVLGRAEQVIDCSFVARQ